MPKKCPLCMTKIDSRASVCPACHRDIPVDNTPFMQRPVVIILALILFAPIGILFVWMNEKLPIRAKQIISAIASIYFIGVLVSRPAARDTTPMPDYKFSPAAKAAPPAKAEPSPSPSADPDDVTDAQFLAIKLIVAKQGIEALRDTDDHNVVTLVIPLKYAESATKEQAQDLAGMARKTLGAHSTVIVQSESGRVIGSADQFGFH